MRRKELIEVIRRYISMINDYENDKNHRYTDSCLAQIHDDIEEFLFSVKFYRKEENKNEDYVGDRDDYNKE